MASGHRITGCILARNEERQIGEALASLRDWTDEILVLDDGSTDATASVAAQYGAVVVRIERPGGGVFDALRNRALEHASGDWIFYLDADERVPPRLGAELCRLVAEHGDEFEALVLPFKHFFCGDWIRHSGWWPGYTRPQLLKKGWFHYNERLHAGVEVRPRPGEAHPRIAYFPADDPELAIVHHSYIDLHHYLEKLNRYTDVEAESLVADDRCHGWRAQLAHFVHDWKVYYDHHHGDRDGVHGFVLAFMSAFYRFAARAKAWDLRRQRGATDGMASVPRDLREALAFMAEVIQYGPKPWLDAHHPPRADGGDPPLEAPPSTAEGPASGEGSILATDPELPRITALVMARNEEQRLPGALRSLQGWVSQVLLLDHGSTDATARIARSLGAEVIDVPYQAERGAGEGDRGQNFDALRNLALPHVRGDWVLVLDADERVSAALATEYVRLARECEPAIAGIVPPYQNFFCGAWIRHAGWWPGYLHLQLLRRGRFRFRDRLHGGIELEGRELHLPPDPERACLHLSYDNLHQYLEKLNRYTDAEAHSLAAAGESHSWQSMLAHFAWEWHLYYEEGRADLSGMHGFVLSFLSAFYRFTSRAKLWDLRRKQGETDPTEPVPRDVREMIEFMARVVDYGPSPWLDGGEARSTPHTAKPPTPAVPSGAASPGVADRGEEDAPALSPPGVVASDGRRPLLWCAPLLDPSGYADEARQFVLGLMEAGEAVALAVEPWGGGEAGLSPEDLARITGSAVPAGTPAEVYVHHTLPPLVAPSPTARINVARTMFETDRIPSAWAASLNRMDRIWVPSEFNRETFVRSGVDPDRVAVLPGAIVPEPFAAPAAPWPLPVPGARCEARSGVRGEQQPFIFLSVFDWTLHKGWDLLLEAFAREFGAERGFALLVKTWSSHHYRLEDLHAQADAHLRARLGRGLSSFPNIYLWQERIPAAELPRLYQAVDAFVLPTRGEGWCRPLMEAMATGLPTVATGWSGITAFHDASVGYVLPHHLRPVPEVAAREIPTYRGHCWAEPDLSGLQALMRRVVEQPEEAADRGRAAQERIRMRFSRRVVARLLQEELACCRVLPRTNRDSAARSFPALDRGSAPPAHVPTPLERPDAGPGSGRASPPFRPPSHMLPRERAPAVDFCARLGRKLRVRWEGDQTLLSSLALVNREFCLGLLASGDIELSFSEQCGPWHTLTPDAEPRLAALLACRDARLSGPPDVTVRHHFPPNWERPPAGQLVVIQPWEYGHLPEEWVEGARGAAEVWAYSRFVRDIYVRSGVPAEKVRVVPLGFDPKWFTPAGPGLALPTRKRFRFLFVGGALDRKGADLLLQAYLEAFRRDDDVCLVVKDMGTRTFYQGATFGEQFRRAAADPYAPEILYLDEDLPTHQLAALYRSCHCLALPYRGEGFALPPLEAMACGLLPIVTSGGPTDDYTTDDTAIRLSHTRRYRGKLAVGFEDRFVCVGDPWQLEPDRGELVRALRTAYAQPDEVRRRGLAAREAVHEAWSWIAAILDVRAALHRLLFPVPAAPESPVRAWEGGGVSKPAQEPAVKAAGDPTRVARWGPVRGKAVSTPPATDGCFRTSPEPAARPGCRRPPSATSRDRRPLLSFCMIARDEEPRIAQCLQSIAPFADELNVVDTGSRDRTREIARECGARVFEFPWCEDFAAARNASLAVAWGDWVFWMDADDVITPDCGRRLRQLVESRPRGDAAFQVQVRIPPGPGEFSASVVDHVKLFPNRPDLRFEHRIHEQILPAIRQARLEVLFSDVFVTHANYDRSDAGQAKKRERDFRLLELDLRDRPEHPFTLFNLGMTYLHAAREYEVAAQYLRRSLDRSHPADSIVRKAYAMLTTCRICQVDWEAAIRANEEGREYYPNDAELLFQAGQLYQQVGRFAEGRRALERLVTGEDDPHYRSVDVGLRTYRGSHELALLFRRMGDGPHCVQVLQEIAHAQPQYAPARLDLAETLYLSGRGQEAREWLASVPESNGTAAELQRLRSLFSADSARH